MALPNTCRGSGRRPGPGPEPQRVYTLFSAQEAAVQTQTPTKPGFYFGGNIYGDWASVPESYKSVGSQPPDPRRSTASLFKFTW